MSSWSIAIRICSSWMQLEHGLDFVSVLFSYTTCSWAFSVEALNNALCRDFMNCRNKKLNNANHLTHAVIPWVEAQSWTNYLHVTLASLSNALPQHSAMPCHVFLHLLLCLSHLSISHSTTLHSCHWHWWWANVYNLGTHARAGFKDVFCVIGRHVFIILLSLLLS